MRTTLAIEDALLEKAKKLSRQRNCSLRQVVEDALRRAVARQPKVAPGKANRPLKTFKGTGLQPGVDLTSSSALLEAMEAR
jgi:hypothetical protein